MTSTTGPDSPNTLTAVYSLHYKLGITSLVAAAAIIVVATFIVDRSGPDPMFTVAACLFTALTCLLLLNVWRKCVCFQANRILVR